MKSNFKKAKSFYKKSEKSSIEKEAFIGEGILINSGEFDNLESHTKASNKIIKFFLLFLTLNIY